MRRARHSSEVRYVHERLAAGRLSLPCKSKVVRRHDGLQVAALRLIDEVRLSRRYGLSCPCEP